MTTPDAAWPEHVDALAALFTVEGHGSDDAPPVIPSLDLTALGPTPQSLTAHQRRAPGPWSGKREQRWITSHAELTETCSAQWRLSRGSALRV